MNSDLRVLYAISKLDDFELLKKEVSEKQVVLTGMQTRIKNRLKNFNNSSPSQVIYNWYFLQAFNFCYFRTPNNSVKITIFEKISIE